MSISTDSIRNIAIVGHGATGKTTFVENLLFLTGVISRPESVESGKTVSDYTDEEIENKISIHTALTHVNWNNCKINLLDTPGSSDFVGEVVAAFRTAETACVVVNGKAGVQIETIKLWRRLVARQLPRIVFINRMDEEGAVFANVLGDLSQKFGATFVPLTVPIGSGSDYRGIVSLLDNKAYLLREGAAEEAAEIPADMANEVAEARAALIEAAAEGDDDLVAKFLEEETLSEEEVLRGLTAGVSDNKLVPVLCGAALRTSGLSAFLNAVAGVCPSPQGVAETAFDQQGNESTVAITGEGPFSALCFKTSIDQFSGKLSFVKLITGTLTSDTELYSVREGKKEKVSKFYTAQGKKLEEINQLCAGDIGILAKIASARTNDTFCTPDRQFTFKPLALPQPVHAITIEGAQKKDEDKLGEALHKVVEEDLTFRVDFNPETKETVVSGMGELHINMILDKIRENHKIEVNTRVPRVAYRETITRPAEATYRHKKQSGGHGQFGEVSIKIRPLERGEQYQFDNLIRGMAVSKGYIPGIEKGLQEAMSEGFVAGYPAVDIGTELTDGKEHSVDSSEMAFKLAAKGAMRDAASKAGPTLLEPVMNLEVFIEEQYLGDVLSDLTGRRGRVLGQEALGGGIISIQAQVPQAELMRYSIDLRSITSGTGSFEVAFDHYSPISGKIADDVIKAAQAGKENS
ncbi:MAG: elongation factor G [Spirochaetaceae bacterium]|nr:MAG: elongation factor G [Spirochaetaceae bacterium]